MRTEYLEVNGMKHLIKIHYENRNNATVSLGNSKEKQNNHISTLISRCVSRKRLPELQEKINELNNLHFNQKLNKIFFKHNKSPLIDKKNWKK